MKKPLASDGAVFYVLSGANLHILDHRSVPHLLEAANRSQERGIEDPVISAFDESATVSAVWHYGSRLTREEAARGPLTLVIVRTRRGWRVAHVNMGNYPSGD